MTAYSAIFANICEKVYTTDEEFKQELYKCYGVEGNPKAEALWRLAWEYGHSAGYSEVLNYWQDMVDLIK